MDGRHRVRELPSASRFGSRGGFALWMFAVGLFPAALLAALIAVSRHNAAPLGLLSFGVFAIVAADVGVWSHQTRELAVGSDWLALRNRLMACWTVVPRAEIARVSVAANQFGRGLRIRRITGRPLFISSDEIRSGAAGAIRDMLGPSSTPDVLALLLSAQEEERGLISRGRTGAKQSKFREKWVPRIGPEAVQAVRLAIGDLLASGALLTVFAVIGIVAGLTNHSYRVAQFVFLVPGIVAAAAFFPLAKRAMRLVSQATGVKGAKFGDIPRDDNAYLGWCRDKGVRPYPFGSSTE